MAHLLWWFCHSLSFLRPCWITRGYMFEGCSYAKARSSHCVEYQRVNSQTCCCIQKLIQPTLKKSGFHTTKKGRWDLGHWKKSLFPKIDWGSKQHQRVEKEQDMRSWKRGHQQGSPVGCHQKGEMAEISNLSIPRCKNAGMSTFLSILILSYPILSYPILSYPILSYPILSYPILSYPILSYPSVCFNKMDMQHLFFAASWVFLAGWAPRDWRWHGEFAQHPPTAPGAPAPLPVIVEVRG